MPDAAKLQWGRERKRRCCSAVGMHRARWANCGLGLRGGAPYFGRRKGNGGAGRGIEKTSGTGGGGEDWAAGIYCVAPQPKQPLRHTMHETRHKARVRARGRLNRRSLVARLKGQQGRRQQQQQHGGGGTCWKARPGDRTPARRGRQRRERSRQQTRRTRRCAHAREQQRGGWGGQRGARLRVVLLLFEAVQNQRDLRQL